MTTELDVEDDDFTDPNVDYLNEPMEWPPIRWQAVAAGFALFLIIVIGIVAAAVYFGT